MPRRRHTEVFPGEDGATGYWYWHCVAGNGEIIDASEGYTRKSSAMRGATGAYPTLACHVRDMRRYDDESGAWRIIEPEIVLASAR